MTIPQQASTPRDSTAGWLWRGVHECRCSPRNSGSVHPDNSLAYPDRDNLSAYSCHGRRCLRGTSREDKALPGHGQA